VADDPTLRELFESKLETIRVEIAAIDKATVLKAQEYERRLDLLNGEHDTLTKMSEKYVPSSSYSIDLAALKADGEKIRDSIEANRVRQERAIAENRRSYTMLGISLGVTLLIALVGWGLTLTNVHIH
jgi:hypothetical protein